MTPAEREAEALWKKLRGHMLPIKIWPSGKPDVKKILVAALTRADARGREEAIKAAAEYLKCVPCPPLCSANARENGLHVDYCAYKVADEPGFQSCALPTEPGAC